MAVVELREQVLAVVARAPDLAARQRARKRAAGNLPQDTPAMHFGMSNLLVASIVVEIALEILDVRQFRHGGLPRGFFRLSANAGR